MTQPTMTRLTARVTAPMFDARDIFGQPVNLSHYKERTLLLSFFRNAACAVCNLQVHQLIQRYPAYQAKGLEIVAVFEATPESIRQYVGKQDAPFPIIANRDARLYDLYGVETSEAKAQASISAPTTPAIIQEAAAHGFALTREEDTNFFRMPADFLIAPDGTILRAFYSELIGEHLAFAEIEQVLGI
jgi:thioredoxin-dependent peroxiredoxin